MLQATKEKVCKQLVAFAVIGVCVIIERTVTLAACMFSGCTSVAANALTCAAGFLDARPVIALAAFIAIKLVVPWVISIQAIADIVVFTAQFQLATKIERTRPQSRADL